jgi:hypothetical protein
MDSREVYDKRKEIKEASFEAKERLLLSLINEALESIPEHEGADNYIFPDDNYSYPEAPKLRAAIFWCRYDLVNFHLKMNDRSKAINCFNAMSKEYNDNDVNDDEAILIENIHRLRNKLDTLFIELSRLQKLSKRGDYVEAYNSMNSLIYSRQLTLPQKEQCGWILYGVINSKIGKSPSLELRRLLKEYFDLDYNQSSILHSSFLSLALKIAKIAPKFRFISFIKIWDLSKLRSEDKNDNIVDGNKYKCLLYRVLSQAGQALTKEDLYYYNDRLSTIGITQYAFYNGLYSGYYKRMYAYFSESNITSLVDTFVTFSDLFNPVFYTDNYQSILVLIKRIEDNKLPPNYSKVLGLIDCNSLDEKLWQKKTVDNIEYPGLIVNLINKWIKFILKNDFDLNDAAHINTEGTTRILNLFEYASINSTESKFLMRNIGLFYSKIGSQDEARKYLSLAALSLNSEYYIWNDLSKCFTSIEDMKNLLGKAISISSSEKFISNIRLKLCSLFYESGNYILASTELNNYKTHYSGSPSNSQYLKLKNSLSKYDIDHGLLEREYQRLSTLADVVIFGHLDKIVVTLFDKWKSKEKNQMISFTNGDDIFFNVKQSIFTSIDKIELGKPYTFYKSPLSHKLKLPKVVACYKNNEPAWSCLPVEIAVVDYISEEHNMIYAFLASGDQVKFSASGYKLKKGDFVSGNLIMKKKKDNNIDLNNWMAELSHGRPNDIKNPYVKSYNLTNITGPTDSNGLEKQFPEVNAIVDNVNNNKELYHYISDIGVSGIINFRDTELALRLGDTILLRYYKKPAYKDRPIRYQHITLSPSAHLPSKIAQKSSGYLTMNGNAFGFINDMYVHPRIIAMNDLTEDSLIHFLAIENKGKWSVVKILND